MKRQRVRKILTHDFILCSFGQAAFGFIYYSLIPTLPIYLERLGSNEAEIGILIGCFAASSLILRPFVGRALLKVPEKKFMIVGALLFALASVAYLFAPPFWPFLITRVVQGLGYAFFNTASFTLIANMSLETLRGQSISYFFLVWNISGALGPPLGMFIINRYSFAFLFLICLGLSLGTLFTIKQLGRRQVDPLKNPLSENSPFLSLKALSPSLISFFSFFIWGAINAFFPIYAINQGVANPGLFFTTVAVMLILGRALGGKIIDFHHKERIILPCLITYIISMGILAFSKTLPMFILAAVIWGIGHAFLIPILLVFALDRVGSSPGPVMGTFHGTVDLGLSLGPVVMGMVLHSTSFPIMFLCLALMGFINLNYFYFFVRKKG